MRKFRILGPGNRRGQAGETKQHVKNSSHKHYPLITAGLEIYNELTAIIFEKLLYTLSGVIKFIGFLDWNQDQNKQKS